MSTPKQDDGGPAFPFGQVSELTGQPINGFFAPGMTLRQYAAIKLRVPKSGTPWLDGMIEEALRNEFAGRALAGMLANERFGCTDGAATTAAYGYADAMLAERRKGAK